MKTLLVIIIVLLSIPCKRSNFLTGFNKVRQKNGIIEIKDMEFIKLTKKGNVTVFYNNDTLDWGDGTLPPENSPYYQFEPYHMYKGIKIDSVNCIIASESDYFIRPITTHIYQSLRIEYEYQEGLPLPSKDWKFTYGIEFMKPFHYTSAHSIPKPDGWFELNVDSLFIEGQPFTNDVLFGRYINRHRRRFKELNIHQADSILKSWVFEGFNENAFKHSEVKEMD